jgi:hypothetical protein
VTEEMQYRIDALTALGSLGAFVAHLQKLTFRKMYSRVSKLVGQRSKHTKNAIFQDPIILVPQERLP